MEITIIAIGDELLLGQVTDTNSGFIARTIGTRGWTVKEVMVVADDAEAIRSAIDQALSQTKIVLTTGGLGPTKDDITKGVLMERFGGELRFDASVLENVKEIFRNRRLPLNRLTEDQALVPTSAKVIQNRCGTAPILWFEPEGRDNVLVAMPGVPYETETMFATEVFPRLLERYPSSKHSVHHTIMVEGISESALAERLASWESALPSHFHLAYLPQQGIIRMRLDGHGQNADLLTDEMDELVAQLIDLCGEQFLYDGDATPQQILLEKLLERKLTIATAESCTGGNIARLLTSIPGSSEVVNGGIVSYANSAKINILGVSADDIATLGAVSIPVVEQMAKGARQRLMTDVAVATSGIAGPGGGTPDKPVGTVCIAVATERRTVSHTYHFSGRREQIVQRASATAMIMAIREISLL